MEESISSQHVDLAKDVLNNLDFSVPREALYATLSKYLPYDEYLSVARTLTRSYAFLIPLFPVHATRTTALVLESRLGSVSASLAAHFHSILCIPATPLDRAFTERRIQQNKIQNVTVLAANKSLDEELTAVELGVIVLWGFPQLTEGHEIGTDSYSWQSFIRLTNLRIGAQGILIIADNNARDYRKWKTMAGLANCIKSSGRLTIPAAGRLMSAHGLRERVYFAGKSTLSPDFWPPPEFISGSESPAAFPYGGNPAKDRAVRTRLLKRFWPAFLFLGSRQRYPSDLDALFMESGVAERVGWAAHEKILVRKLVAGNADTTVIIAGPENRYDADVVVRIPDSEEGRIRCETNVMSLGILERSPIANRTPKLHATGMWHGRMYSVESRCTGREFLGSRHKSKMDMAVRKACEMLLRYHEQSCVRQPVTEQIYRNVVESTLTVASRFSDARTNSRIDILNQQLHEVLTDSEMAIGHTHGDFKLGNILFDHRLEACAIIDWDYAQNQGMPLLDYLTCLIYQLAQESGRLRQVYIEQILPWHLSATAAKVVEEAVTRLGLSETQFLALRIVLWFTLTRDRFDPCFMAQPGWRLEYHEHILGHIEKQSRRLG